MSSFLEVNEALDLIHGTWEQAEKKKHLAVLARQASALEQKWIVRFIHQIHIQKEFDNIHTDETNLFIDNIDRFS